MLSKIAKTPLWAAFRLISRASFLLHQSKYRYVFILGHMRSGSTLLSHILANHPNFVGAGETHLTYRTETDLPNLVLRTSELLHRPVLREKYIVDQVNHAYLTSEILTSMSIYKCIILIREPTATIKSMMSLSIWQEQEAIEIYSRRLETLARYGATLGTRAFLLQYDDLIDSTQRTLAALTAFFGLQTPLTSNYATHRMTKRIPGFGDPSENIKAGQIFRTPGQPYVVNSEGLEQATIAFENCLTSLKVAAVQTI